MTHCSCVQLQQLTFGTKFFLLKLENLDILARERVEEHKALNCSDRYGK